jgi:hypothetical protein
MTSYSRRHCDILTFAIDDGVPEIWPSQCQSSYWYCKRLLPRSSYEACAKSERLMLDGCLPY